MKMSTFLRISLLLLLILILGCTGSSPIQPEPSKETPVNQPTKQEIMTVITPEVVQIPYSFDLAEPGPYFAGNRAYTLVDNSRDGREIELLIWYPALREVDENGRPIIRDAAANPSDGPYPLILTEENSGRSIFLSHLATHGFVMVKVKSPSSDPAIESNGFGLVRDFLFSLDQIATYPPDGLENVIDTNRVGVTGYSYGGDISLTISGARVDPEFYLSQCAQVSNLVPPTFQWIYQDLYCQDARNWDAFADFMGPEITQSSDGLWQPWTDERIKAVMPMAPSVSWYFGERGLAAVDRPTFIIWGTKDILSPYQLEAGFTFENLTIPDRFLVSFVGRSHGLPFNEESQARIKHFATAFFGFYLQGRKDYAAYFSEEFVSQFQDLHWGVYANEH